MRRFLITIAAVVALATNARAAEFHVAVSGQDTHPGTPAAPLRTVQRAAELAQPGDVITVHEGVYREHIRSPRGGESDEKRIVYQAAPGEKVIIKGSEVVRDWQPVMEGGRWEGNHFFENPDRTTKDGKPLKPLAGLWKATIPNTLFGAYNPFTDVIAGDWLSNPARLHTGQVYLDGKSLFEVDLMQFVTPGSWIPHYNTRTRDKEGAKYAWCCNSDETNTYIYAQFRDKNPNECLVEINVRPAVFYPEKPGINYITVRGFTLCHAATQWAPPTAEQVGLIGTHWSRGWIIENNVISDSRCSGVTLGKYGDEWDNKSANSAGGYVQTIERALQNGWDRQTIGHHIVRNNTIFNCEQTGICGSLGAVFSRITGNHI